MIMLLSQGRRKDRDDECQEKSLHDRAPGQSGRDYLTPKFKKLKKKNRGESQARNEREAPGSIKINYAI